MQRNGQLHASASLAPVKQTPVAIGGRPSAPGLDSVGNRKALALQGIEIQCVVLIEEN
jgi:hypothetical protein